jgi:hypothetical protein
MRTQDGTTGGERLMPVTFKCRFCELNCDLTFNNVHVETPHSCPFGDDDMEHDWRESPPPDLLTPIEKACETCIDENNPKRCDIMDCGDQEPFDGWRPKKKESPPPCHVGDCEWRVEGRCRGNFEACNQFKEDDCPRVHRLEKALHEIRRLEILDCYEKCDNYPETDEECTDEECPKYPIIKLTKEASEQ